MRIIHVVSSMSAVSGGVARSTLLTLQGSIALGIDAQLYTNEEFPGGKPISEEPFIHFLPLPRLYEGRWGYSGTFKKALSDSYPADVYHIQGLWQYPGYAGAQFAARKKIPYIITLHGMLYPNALSHSSLIKKTAMFLFLRRQLQEAACVHVTCEQEMEHYRNLGFTNSVALVPCPMECPDKMPSLYSDGIKRVGYLGRIHPRKHIERLLEVWSRLNEPGELLIMGEGDQVYMNFLKKEVARLGLNRVYFTGFVTGEKKQRLLASLTCLVVPSDFENFGLITPETLLQEIPVIVSKGSPWKELETHRCGWWVNDNDVDTFTMQVREALSMDEETLKTMGRRGRRLILDKYSVDVVSRQMEQLYDWITGQAGKPEFIYD